MDKGFVPYIIAGAVAVVGYLFGWLQNRQRASVDESTLILGKWKELVDTHQSEIKLLKEEFATYRVRSEEEFTAYRARAESELGALRDRVADLERDLINVRTESMEQAQRDGQRIKDRDDEIVGLKRTIAQNSQSSAMVIGDLRDDVSKMQDEKHSAHEKIGGRIDSIERRARRRGARDDATNADFQDQIDRMDRLGDNSIPKEER